MKLYRTLHRYLGVVIGIQFLFWTVGGAFFAWSDLEQIHGDLNKKSKPVFEGFHEWKNPDLIFASLDINDKPDSVISFKAIDILGEPVYQVSWIQNSVIRHVLVEAKTGKIRKPLNEYEAAKLAELSFTPESKVDNVEFLNTENVNRHHEYRNQPLPAYAITFKHPSGTVVYVSAELGEVLKFRNSNWRVFDFFWMLHTMDYKGRHNFGNLLLRLFSVLGFLTVLSGFWLFFKSWRIYKNRKQPNGSLL